MKKLVGLLVSLVLLALIWWRVDLDAIAAAMRAANPVWLALGLLMVAPLMLVTALRFGMLTRTPIGWWPATRLILGASTLNLVLPSKMGDIAKGLVLTGRHGFDAKLAVALVVMERSLDMAALLFWGVLAMLWVGRDSPLMWLAAAGTAGLLAVLMILLAPTRVSARLLELLARVAPGKAGRWLGAFAGEWEAAIAWFWSDRRRVVRVALVSLGLWAAHLAQFWMFAQALAPVPFLDNMAFATLAILAGLLPLTMAGIGTRDAAILLLYRPFLSPGQAAVLGVLATLRYLIPAIAGLPFMGDYLQRSGRKEAVRQ